jgi:hypothetical protein
MKIKINLTGQNPVRPDKNIPVKPDTNPDPTRPRPGGNDPDKNDPTRIEEPPRTDPTRIDNPPNPNPAPNPGPQPEPAKRLGGFIFGNTFNPSIQ